MNKGTKIVTALFFVPIGVLLSLALTSLIGTVKRVSSNVAPKRLMGRKLLVYFIGLTGMALGCGVWYWVANFSGDHFRDSRKWREVLAVSMSPFACNSCGHKLTELEVVELEGGIKMGSCSVCGVDLMDRTPSGRDGASNEDIRQYKQELNAEFRRRYGSGGFSLSPVGGMIFTVLLCLGYIGSMRWLWMRVIGSESVGGMTVEHLDINSEQ